MANQRKKSKKVIAVWLDKKEMSLLNAIIKSGVSKDRADFVKHAILSESERLGITEEKNGCSD